MRWKKCLLAAMCGVGLIVGTAAAEPWDAGEDVADDAMRRVACLDLTPEQSRKIRLLQTELFRAVDPLRIQIFERRAELRLLWMQMTPDEPAIRAKQHEIHDLRWKIQDHETDFWLRLRRILAPDQLSKFLVEAGGPDRSPTPLRRPPLPPARRPPPGKW